jgi:ATP-binding cassette subfamily B (MDR/TAP) protein 8
LRLDDSSVRGDVEFHNVWFRYPSRNGDHVLKRFSLRIPRGKVVAVVGPSGLSRSSIYSLITSPFNERVFIGSGKSTLVNLLEGFYPVEKGEITLDGIRLDYMDPTWLRGEVLGLIQQEPVLFATSILENIRYGRPSATDEEVIEAAKNANAHNFIQEFPMGYDTKLGERGVTVSGGQKQRIAIARALIKNPTVLILDEATR